MITITNEDNMELMARYPDKYFDLAIVDPPYGIDVAKMAYTQEDGRIVKQKNGESLRVKGKKYKHGEWDKAPADQDYLNELIRVSKNQIIWGINYMDFHLKGGRIVWDKHTPEGVSFSDAEIAYCSLHERTRVVNYMWSGMMQGTYIGKDKIKACNQQGNKQLNEKRYHPTQKPVKLYEWLLMTYAKAGYEILDTHLGVGSIALACHNLGFDLTACELDPDYYKTALKRLKQHQQQLAIKYTY